MNQFLGTYANLAGRQIGNFTIEGLGGLRDSSGAPRWRVICDRCHYPQIIPHTRLAPLVQGAATQTTLRCANPSCPLSRHESKNETIEQFRQREKRQEELGVRATEEANRVAAVNSEKQRAQAMREFEVQRQYARYVAHQLAADQDESKICTRQRWFELTDGTRQIVMDAIKDPTVRIGAL
jgi:hypothetical protein